VAGRGYENPSEVIGQNYPIADDEIFQEIQHTRRPLLISDVQSCYQFKGYGGTQNICSWIGVPLIARGIVIGCLTIDSYTPDAYMEVEQGNLAQAFANHASIAIENARLFKVEREQRQLAEALREINLVLSATLDFDNLLDLLLDQVRRVVPYSVANIMLVEEGKIRIARTNYLENINSDKVQLMKTSPFHIFATPNLDHIVKTGQSLVISMVPEDADWIESSVPIRSWIGAPIIVNGKVTACFSLCNFEPGFYDYEHAELLSIYAGQAALALKNAELFSKIQQLAILDDLTGVFNRRHFFELGEREFHRAQRYDRPLSVVMFDLDHFKRVNDTYGHAVGDQVLRVVAEYCKSNIREVDILGRYGGDEFTIILPEVDSEEACEISERIRNCIASTPIKTEAGQINITISMGTASLCSEMPNLTKLINYADSAMYEAKSKGQNFACVYSEVKV
jgi:diguanylate cyclase (GGDEF)-like protein